MISARVITGQLPCKVIQICGAAVCLFGCVVGPLLGLPAEFAAAVGLVSIFCGATNALIPSILLGFELFSGAGLELIALGCGICYMLSGHHGLYSSQTFVTNKLRSEYMSHKWRVKVKKAEE